MKPGTTIYNAQYRIEETLAVGGFATVYRATTQNSRETVALKISKTDPDPAYANALKREAELLRKLDHPNIVRIYPIPRTEGRITYYVRAIEIAGDSWFFVMEYLAGGTLEHYLKQVGQLSVPEAAAIGLQIAEAVHYLHTQGYTHNDLKLENIIFKKSIQVGQPFMPILVDFGIAARVKTPEGASLYVMAPEQLQQIKTPPAPEAYKNLDKIKIDVWGLGVILYRMLSDRLPFQGGAKTMTDRILHSTPASLYTFSGGISPHINDLIINGCLAKEPHHRLTMTETIRMLKPLAEGARVIQAPSEKKRRWPFG